MRELFRTQCLTSIFAQALGTYHTDEINLPRNPITFALSHYHLSGYAVLPLDNDYFSGTGIGKAQFMRYLMDDIEFYKLDGLAALIAAYCGQDDAEGSATSAEPIKAPLAGARTQQYVNTPSCRSRWLNAKALQGTDNHNQSAYQTRGSHRRSLVGLCLRVRHRLMIEVEADDESKATMVRHTTSTLLEVKSLLGLRGPLEAKRYPEEGTVSLVLAQSSYPKQATIVYCQLCSML